MRPVFAVGERCSYHQPGRARRARHAPSPKAFFFHVVPYGCGWILSGGLPVKGD